MDYLTALYGSQYDELVKNGKNGASGRLNGNLFLTAFIIISIFLIITIFTTISDDISNQLNRLFHQWFGYSSGKAIGRLLAIPLMAIIYLILANTIGNKTNYMKWVEKFNSFPEEERKKATMKILKPFFIVLGAFFLLIMSSLFR